MKKLFALTLTLALFCFSEPVFAQDKPAEQPSAEELQKQKAEREKNAYRLLDQVIDEAQSLRLTENRVRVQISSADMLWDQNQGRARSLFTMAAEGVVELDRVQAAAAAKRIEAMQDGNGFTIQRPIPPPQNFRSFQLRQELVLAAARHDAALAYQLLASTKPPATTQPAGDQRGPRPQVNAEENLEQQLLARIAALDPKLAAQNAEQMIEKGQFPRTLPEVINQLRRQDAEAADKLTDKTVKKIQAANLLTNNEASMLVQTLLAPGIRLPASEGAAAAQPTNRRGPTLDQSAYVELLSAVIDAALKVTPAPRVQANANANTRRVQATPAPGASRPTSGPQPPTDAQVEQNNARRLLAGLQPALPVIDQFLPAKAALVRQKMAEMGLSTSYNPTFTGPSGQGSPTADSLVQAAANAPQQAKTRLYQQAAYRALEEGDTEKARQIANDYLQNNARDVVMQRIAMREMTKKADGARLEEVRQAVARLQSDNQKIDLFIQAAKDTQKIDPKLSVQFLDEARQITNRRATSYEHFEQQLRVARAYAEVDPARSFEMLDPGISQLNELLSAAAVLSGFEINMFREGEMSMQAGNGLTSTINRYGQELALLARTDLERSETLAGRFQFAEPRIMARLAIIKGLLGTDPSGSLAFRAENVIIR